MDRECIKRMGHSLAAFSRHRSLQKMSKEQLADMPKEIIVSCAPHEVSEVWEKLPERLRNDVDIINCLYAKRSTEAVSTNDTTDSTKEKQILCCFCNIEDGVEIASGNSVTLDGGSASKKI